MNRFNRRSFLSAVGGTLLAGVALAGCTTTKVGSTTTVTIIPSKINAYVKAGLNAANTAATVIAMVPVLAVYSDSVKKAIAILNEAAAAFAYVAGDNVVLQYNSASVKTAVDSVLASIETIADLVGEILKALVKAGFSAATEALNKLELARDAIATIVSVFQALLATSWTSAAPMTLVAPPMKLAMTETHALRTLGV